MTKLKCSRCGKELNTFIIQIENAIKVIKVSDTGVLLPYNNLSEPTSEYLCKECFDKYCEKIDELNKEYNGEYLMNMVEVIDDVQYGSNSSC